MSDYSVLVEALGDGSQRISDPDARAGALMDRVGPFRGVCSVGADGWGARVRIEAADAVEAGAVGAALVRALAAKADLPPWPIVRVDAVRSDLHAGDAGQAPPGGVTAGDGG